MWHYAQGLNSVEKLWLNLVELETVISPGPIISPDVAKRDVIIVITLSQHTFDIFALKLNVYTCTLTWNQYPCPWCPETLHLFPSQVRPQYYCRVNKYSFMFDKKLPSKLLLSKSKYKHTHQISRQKYKTCAALALWIYDNDDVTISYIWGNDRPWRNNSCKL